MTENFISIKKNSGCGINEWGGNCQQRCHCHGHGSCDPQTGHCVCAAGWTGENCQTPCSEGTYGPNCRLLCHCQNGATCDKANGACYCTMGFKGSLYVLLFSISNECSCFILNIGRHQFLKMTLKLLIKK